MQLNVPKNQNVQILPVSLVIRLVYSCTRGPALHYPICKAGHFLPTFGAGNVQGSMETAAKNADKNVPEERCRLAAC